MRGYRGLTLASLLVVPGISAGCQGVGHPETVVSPEPSLSGAVESDTTVADGTHTVTPVKTTTVVDRHPLIVEAARLLGDLGRQQGCQGRCGNVRGCSSRNLRRVQADHRRCTAGTARTNEPSEEAIRHRG